MGLAGAPDVSAKPPGQEGPGQASEGQRVKTPSNFIRSTDFEVARILHDSRDLSHHLTDNYRAI